MSEETHKPLSLKYRPMTFQDVVGQEHVVGTLRHALETNRVANAYLFIGSRGIGKTTLSRIFAKALNCTSPNGVEPCGTCENCRAIAGGRSIDVIELDAASHNKVEDVRPIIDDVQFPPTLSRYKIYIIDECHMLSAAAWNALLKTLEEPPPYARFIFATTEGDKVLATIISRCQRFDLRRIQTHDIVSRLTEICGKESIKASPDALLAIARGAEGGMRDALSSLDQLVSFRGSEVSEEDALAVFGLISRAELEKLAGAILTGDTAAILNAIETFDSAGKNMRRIVSELLMHFRNLVVVQALGTETTSLEATPDQIQVLARQAKGIDAARVFRICDQLAEAEDKLRHVLSVRTLIEISLLRASRIATTASIEELMRAVKALRGGSASASPAPAAPAPAAMAKPAPTATVKPVPVSVSPAAPAGSSRSSTPSRYAGHSLPSVEELMAAPAPAAPTPAAPASSAVMAAPTPAVNLSTRQDILDGPVVNGILSAIPGSTVMDIQEGGNE